MDKGGAAWAGMAAGIAAYDYAAENRGWPTMSASFFNALHHPIHRWWVIGSWAFITGHLFAFIPRRLDPLRRWAHSPDAYGRWADPVNPRWWPGLVRRRGKAPLSGGLPGDSLE